MLAVLRDILDLANVSDYWIEAINGGVILFVNRGRKVTLWRN